MADPAPRPTRVWQHDDRTLGIAWTSGREILYDVVALRRACPCAVCVDEGTGERRLAPDDVDDDVRPSEVASVGRYAMRIAFDDGHDTGVYSFAMLHDRWSSP